MAGVVQFASGYESMLGAWIDGLSAYCHLYVNDPDLSEPRVTADFVEASFPGYAPLAVGPWTPPALRAGRAVAVVDPLAFTLTGTPAPPPIRGYYVTAGPSGALLWAWRKVGAGQQLTAAAPTLIVHITAFWPPAFA